MKSSHCKRIPISSAKKISVEYDFPEVVIFAYDPVSGNQHVTTYGKTLEQCKDAARAGNYLKKALGWPEEQCHAVPSRAKKDGENGNKTENRTPCDNFDEEIEN